MSGIRFNNSQVTIAGDVVNVEGNQINVSTAPAPEVATAIAAIVANRPPEELPALLTDLDEAAAQRPELTEALIADAVVERLGDAAETERGRLREILTRIGEAATTNVVTQGVVIGLRAVLGI